jgi:hypothetical protein
VPNHDLWFGFHARVTPVDLRLRAYTSTRRLLRRLRMQAWFDVYACQILAAPAAARGAPSQWASEELWTGEVEAGCGAWLTAAHPHRAGEMQARWQAGYRCFAATTSAPPPGGSCAASLWAAVGPTRFHSRSLGRWWDIPQGVAWIFDAWAHPLSLGTYPYLNRFAVACLCRQGVAETWSQVEFGNRVSLRLLQRWGAVCVGRAVVCRVAGLSWSRVMTQPSPSAISGPIRPRPQASIP